MELQNLIYDDGVIAVGLVMSPHVTNRVSLAIRWLEPRPYTDKTGRLVEITNLMGGATDWFILPSTFGHAIGRVLIEQKSAGLQGFMDDGFAALVGWLVDAEAVEDAMCY